MRCLKQGPSVLSRVEVEVPTRLGPRAVFHSGDLSRLPEPVSILESRDYVTVDACHDIQHHLLPQLGDFITLVHLHPSFDPEEHVCVCG